MEFNNGQKVALGILVVSVLLICGYEYWLWHYVPKADYYICYKEIPLYGQAPNVWSCNTEEASNLQNCTLNTSSNPEIEYLRCEYKGTSTLPSS